MAPFVSLSCRSGWTPYLSVQTLLAAATCLQCTLVFTLSLQPYPIYPGLGPAESQACLQDLRAGLADMTYPCGDFTIKEEEEKKWLGMP